MVVLNSTKMVNFPADRNLADSARQIMKEKNLSQNQLRHGNSSLFLHSVRRELPREVKRNIRILRLRRRKDFCGTGQIRRKAVLLFPERYGVYFCIGNKGDVKAPEDKTRY